MGDYFHNHNILCLRVSDGTTGGSAEGMHPDPQV